MARSLQEAPAPRRTWLPGPQSGARARDGEQGTQATGVCFVKQMALPRGGDAKARGNPNGLDLALTTLLLQLKKAKNLPDFAMLSPTVERPDAQNTVPHSAVPTLTQQWLLKDLRMHEKMLDITIDHTDANQTTMSYHTSQNGHHQKIYKQSMLERVWRKGNPHILLVGM